jgi:hypothetical protein
MAKQYRHKPKRNRKPETAQHTQIPIPVSSCDCPPWELCEHTYQLHDEISEVSIETWDFLKSIK